jgi:hypothetical protein
LCTALHDDANRPSLAKERVIPSRPFQVAIWFIQLLRQAGECPQLAVEISPDNLVPAPAERIRLPSQGGQAQCSLAGRSDYYCLVSSRQDAIRAAGAT